MSYRRSWLVSASLPGALAVVAAAAGAVVYSIHVTVVVDPAFAA